ncbi:MAG: methionyl-tRNA formyltransferase [Fibrobacteria bacterium]|jgi:methionyl-tRNA formyltransferase|nr:methionyl-tRNA formyltransferase [Fibrobacteria bacterium]
MLNLVFMGTPDFAVPVLESLAGAHRVSLVVTQPDKPKGRGQHLAAPPVKQKALELDIPVAQPASLKTPEFHDLIAAQKADLLVVVAFRILPATLFPLARLGAVNIHGSLLPRYRGAAPIQWAVARGDAETGVTIFQLDAEVDHGMILAQAKTPIGPDETSEALFARLSAMGRDLLLKTLEDLEAGRTVPRAQDHAQASPAPKLRKEDGAIDWNLPAAAIHNRVRAFNPYPACYATEMLPSGPGRVLRVHRSRPAPAHGGAPGELRAGGGEPFVGTGDGALQLLEVQWEGKPRISGRDLVNGLRGAPLRFLTEGAA